MYILDIRIDAIEQSVDHITAWANQNMSCIQTLQDQFDIALIKIDDFENRSRRYNLRIRRLPESVLDVQNIL